MKASRVGVPLALALAAACSDEPTGPPPFVAVSIEHSAIPLEERTIQVGETLQLGAELLNASGRPATGPAVSWRSTAAEVASVDAAGLVTGRAQGVTLVVATAGSVADTARINVASPVTGPVACASGDPTLRLSVGEVFTTTADRAVTLCVEGDQAGEYVLIPFNGSRVASSQARLSARFEATGTIPTTTALSDASPLRSAAPATRSAAPESGDFHRALRRRAMPALQTRMRALHAAGPGASRSLAAAAVPKVGDVLRLNADTRSVDGCSDPVYRTGKVVAVTARAVVVADTANPEGFSDAEYRDFGTAFDELVYPLDTEYFGTPTDLDGNQRVIVFFTRAVNEMTTVGSGFYVAGFFYDRDLFPTQGSGACAGSNQAELFYMMVPDPERVASGQLVFTKSHVKDHTVSVLAHEFQHLINASRRLHVNEAPVWEEEWLNEGMSHIAEELLFYREAGLSPRSNHSPATIPPGAAREWFAAHQLQNVERLLRYMGEPQLGSPIANDDELATRGASWSFLRYAADRRGGDERQLWRALVDSRTSGLTNLRAALGSDPVDWLHDWSIALYLDDTRIAPAPAHRMPSWNLRSILPVLVNFGGSQNYTRYPLALTALWGESPTTLRLRGGSTAFLRFGVPAGQRAAIRTTSGDLPAPSTLRLAVVRTK